MAALGTLHLGAATGPDPARRLAFLQAMLGFAQHPFLPLADRALGFWAKAMQDAAAAAGKAPAAGAAAAATPSGALPPECLSALVSLVAESLERRGAGVPQEGDELPPYFDSFLVSGTWHVGAVAGEGGRLSHSGARDW